METVIPNFNYDDETNLLCLVALGVSHAKELAEENPSYWNHRVDDFEKVLSKLQTEVHNFHFNK